MEVSHRSSELTEEMVKMVQDKLPELCKLIESHLGFSPELRLSVQKGGIHRVNIKISSGSLINELGNTLVKTIFSDIKIDFWGGTKVISANSIWFNPKLSYEHPSGGSNGTDFLWDALWFDLDKNQWLEGRKLI